MQPKRILTLTAVYPQDPDAVFAKAVSIEAMVHASEGFAVYHGLPKGVFEDGKSYGTYSVTRGWLHNPQGAITVERLDPAFRVLHLQETGRLIRSWDHKITIDRSPEGALWTDQIRLDCGLFSGVAARLARALHQHRHQRRHAIRIESQITGPLP